MYMMLIVFAITAGPNALNTQQIQFSTKSLCEDAMQQFSKARLPQYVNASVQCFKVKY